MGNELRIRDGERAGRLHLFQRYAGVPGFAPRVLLLRIGCDLKGDFARMARHPEPPYTVGVSYWVEHDVLHALRELGQRSRSMHAAEELEREFQFRRRKV